MKRQVKAQQRAREKELTAWEMANMGHKLGLSRLRDLLVTHLFRRDLLISRGQNNSSRWDENQKMIAAIRKAQIIAANQVAKTA
jgi:hypothetical protein